MLKKHWPIVLVLIVLTLLLLNSFILSYINHGRYVYVNDDAYIHMAISKNLAQHGTWGINKEHFTSSSSSLLWTLLLSAVFFVFGTSENIPFFLNFIIMFLSLIFLYNIFLRHKIHKQIIFISLISILLFSPIPFLFYTGQEHLLHLMLTIFFAYYSSAYLASNKVYSKELLYAIILAPCLTMARYEAIFIVFIIMILMFFKKRFKQGIIVSCIAAMPLIIYGIISLAKGWYFFPNSVLLKGKMPDLFSFAGIFKFIFYSAYEVQDNLYAFVLVVLALCVLVCLFKINSDFFTLEKILIILFMGTTFLHMQFAQMSKGAYRYDAYLVALGIFALTISCLGLIDLNKLKNYSRKERARLISMFLLVFIMTLPFFSRAYSSLILASQAPTNIYEQQYQMGTFLKKYYNDSRVIANDIGVINYLADIYCLDLVGLGSIETARAIREGYNTSDYNNQLAMQLKMDIAVLYDEWFSIPKTWIKVASWQISNNVAVGSDKVHFYAFNHKQAAFLFYNLHDFEKELPETVKQTIYKW
ncbi:MAG: hypothetical protein ABIA04_04455 [Pseudomonadota bacterium]